MQKAPMPGLGQQHSQESASSLSLVQKLEGGVEAPLMPLLLPGVDSLPMAPGWAQRPVSQPEVQCCISGQLGV